MENGLTSEAAAFREKFWKTTSIHAVLDHYAWQHECHGLLQMPIAAQVTILHGQDEKLKVVSRA